MSEPLCHPGYPCHHGHALQETIAIYFYLGGLDLYPVGFQNHTPLL